MFSLKFNKKNTTKQELNQIGKRFKEYLNDKQFMGGPELNVLNLCRTDLFALVLNIFIRLEIHTILKLNVDQLLDFLMDVAEKYTQAPYHSFYHAIDIVTMLYYLIVAVVPQHDGRKLTDLDVAFLMVAALCHDMGHPGLNNAFQKNTKSELAIKYNEKSILETYSVDLTIDLLKKHNIQHPQLNDTIRDLILSTDMEFHSDIVSQQKRLITNNNTDKLSFSRILLHAADVSNMARPWHISKQWSNLIVQELFNQGDQEKKFNMTISPGMDRQVSTQKNISLKFGEIIFPFFESLVSLLPKSHVLLDYLASNRIQWTQEERSSLDSPSSSTAVSTKTTARKRKYQQPDIRRISSDITAVQHQQSIIISHKRIRLGYRSHSFPTILHQSAAARFCGNSISISRNRGDSTHTKATLLFPPLVNFKSPSLYDSSNSNLIESSSSTIVLYHPYDP